MGRTSLHKVILLISLATSLSPMAHASIPRDTKTTVKITSSKTVLLQATKDALGLPPGNRMQVLQSQGGEGYRNLIAIMFNSQVPMETRWRAVTAAGRMGGRDSVPELERALKREEWYMRSAGLVAMTSVDRQSALKWAKKLVSDRALVVRASAVTTLADLKDASAAPILWQKLYAKENFKGSQSLFIRRRIVEALAEIESSGSERKFVDVLADKDEYLHGPAIEALERMTHQQLGQATDPLTFRRERWQKWWKAQVARNGSTPRS